MGGDGGELVIDGGTPEVGEEESLSSDEQFCLMVVEGSGESEFDPLLSPSLAVNAGCAGDYVPSTSRDMVLLERSNIEGELGECTPLSSSGMGGAAKHQIKGKILI